MFAARDLSVSFGTTPVLDHLDLTVPSGHRIALVGENGSGKSTLLNVLAGVMRPDGGAVTRPDGRIGMMTQVPPWPEPTTVGEVITQATAWATSLTEAVTAAGERMAADPDDPAAEDALSRAISRADAAAAWDAADRVGVLIDRLGLTDLPGGRAVGQLSGGQRTRLQVLHLLALRPQAMLLDEPTNHLDDDVVALLTEQVRALPGPVVFSSHDRQFVEDVATGVLELDPLQGAPTIVPGGWTAHRREHLRRRRQWQDEHRAQRRAQRALRARETDIRRDRRAPRPRDGDKFIVHHGAQTAQATTAAKLRRTRDDLRRLDDEQVRKPPTTLQMRVDDPTRQGPVGVLISAVEAAVEGRLSPTSVHVDATTRLLVTGANGSGKSTLLQLLHGSLRPTDGHVLTQPGVVVSRLGQDVPEAVRAQTPRAWYGATAGAEVPPLVSLGLIRPADLDRPTSELSIGQRRRLALAVAIAHRPHVLLLDEPTDHLSPTLVEDLEEAIGEASGAVVIASHDRWLRRRWEGDHLALCHAPAG